jgi:hypothetical protein
MRGRRGAYGLTLDGVESPALVDAPASWPAVRVTRHVGRRGDERTSVGSDSAHIALETAGHIAVERDPPAIAFTTVRPLADDELAHPFLARPAALLATWHGHVALHAGAVLAGDGACLVSGAREAGKSSLLAALAVAGHGVLADDLVVATAAATALAGPRTIDLRDADTPLGGAALEPARQHTRWRLALADVPAEVPLRALVSLEWGGDVRVEPLGADERFAFLQQRLTLGRLPADRRPLLALTALPGFRLVRPRRWDAVPETIEALLTAVARA